MSSTASVPGVVRDPFGHRWNIGHHIEDVSADEMQRRYTQLLGGA
jgi:PhnB protein